MLLGRCVYTKSQPPYTQYKEGVDEKSSLDEGMMSLKLPKRGEKRAELMTRKPQNFPLSNPLSLFLFHLDCEFIPYRAEG